MCWARKVFHFELQFFLINISGSRKYSGILCYFQIQQINGVAKQRVECFIVTHEAILISHSEAMRNSTQNVRCGSTHTRGAIKVKPQPAETGKLISQKTVGRCSQSVRSVTLTRRDTAPRVLQDPVQKRDRIQWNTELENVIHTSWQISEQGGRELDEVFAE